MNKGKVARVAGFVGALGLSTVLVTTAVQGTGAWFTDSHSGTIQNSTGHLKLGIDVGAGYSYEAPDTVVNFNGLWPGEDGISTIGYQVDTGAGHAADLWLVFDTSGYVELPNSPTNSSNVKWGTPYQLFTGGGDDDNTGLGRFGFFKVSDSNGGTAFKSGNLKFADSSNNPTTNGCPTDANGRGGSSEESDGTTTPLFCGVPSEIKLASGLTNMKTGTVTIKFHYNGPKQEWQDQAGPTVPFKLVATQAGHRP